MIFATFLSLLCLLACVCFIDSSILQRRRRSARRLPPGPPPLPLIGNIHQLGRNKPHQSLAKLAKTHGPLMHMKLGVVDMIVVSSPEVAKQVLQTHDHILSGRPIPRVTLTREAAMSGMPVGDEWRALRKLCKDQIFSSQKLDAGQGLRRTKLEELRNYVQKCCDRGQVVSIADVASTISLNLISNTIFSMDFEEFSPETEFRELIHDILQLAATPDLAVYLPFLAPFDLQGRDGQMEVLVGKLIKIFNGIIDQRLESKESQLERNDLLKILIENGGGFSRDKMLNLLTDLFVAGVDTTGTSIEWIMTSLIRNPVKMMRARNELQTIVGEKRHVEESDIPNLSYLDAILKETFRLYPVAPLLVPHKAEADVEINGYTIPKNAQILVNVWAIGRDPSIWPNPESFEPERFLDMKIDLRGQDFELIPFGSGRRMCPRMSWAMRIVPVVLATLIKDFEWTPNEKGFVIRPEDMNIDEMFEFVLHKAVPLEAFPSKLQ